VKSAPAGVRISAGTLKGRRLVVPPQARPSEGKVKEALFSILGGDLEGARFLDLFAASGAVGLESISRGALAATFVESDRKALAILAKNLSLAPPGACELIGGDVDRVLLELVAAGRKFDVVFADPPYSRPPEEGFLRSAARLLAPGGKLVFEHSSRVGAPAEAGDLVRIETRRYGLAALSFYGKPQ
jgi:16S rRNA (guanine966-N2)-methyltransferase